MKSWKTPQSEIFQVLAGRSNVYLVRHGKVNILVDSGGFLRYPFLKKRLNHILAGEKLDYLFLTHSHFDHVQRAARIKAEYGCRVIIDERESGFLARGSSPLPEGTNLLSKLIVSLGRKLTRIDTYSPVRCDICVDDIYELKSREDPVRMLRTPGHSPGSASIILDDEIAIVGDNILKLFRPSVYPPFADNPEELLNSWELLLQTNCRIFLAGHGFPIKRKYLERELEKRRKKFQPIE